MRPGPSCASLCIIFRREEPRKGRRGLKTLLFKLLAEARTPFGMLQNDTVGPDADPLDFAGAAASQFKGKAAARDSRPRIRARIIFEPMPMINQRNFAAGAATIRLPAGPVRRAFM
jgi:hypothetical protein